MSTRYTLAKVKLRAEIDGTDFDVVSCQIDYALNSIPRCSLELAIGRDVRTQQPAKVHTAQSSLSQMKPLKVYTDIEGDFAPNEPWPKGEKLIFEGYVTGCGYQKMRGNAQFKVDGLHWLSDLDFSSTLTELSHPNNPWATSTSGLRPSTAAGINEKPTMTSTLNGQQFFQVGKVTSDLWGEALQPFLCKLAETDLAKISFVGSGDNCSLSGGGNRKALDAIKKIAGGGCSSVGKDFYKALSIQASGAGEQFAASVTAFLNVVLSDSAYYGSFWSVIVNRIAPSFMFAVVPMSDRALVVPFMPNTTQTYKREIYVEDQDMFQLDKSFARPLKGVLIYSGNATRTSLPDGQDPIDSNTVLTGGCYTPGGQDSPGMILAQPAPGWLAGVIPIGLPKPEKTANQGRRSVTTPDGAEGKADKDPEEAARSVGSVYNSLAKAVYGNEILRGRTGSIVGKLRFDIAPGSMVKIHGSSEKHTSGDQLGQNMVGAVARVSCQLDAERCQASTGFQFMALRTEHENGVETLTQSDHPLFQQTFTGAPLVKEYEM